MTVSYTRKGVSELQSDTVTIPPGLTTVPEYTSFLKKSNTFLSYYSKMAKTIATSLHDAQNNNQKFRYQAKTALRPHLMPMTSCCFDKDAELFVTTSHDRTAKVYSVDKKTGAAMAHSLEGHENTVFTAALAHPSCDTVATASFDGTARLWSCSTGAELAALSVPGDVHEVLSAAFTPDGGELLAYGTASGSCYLWDVNRADTPVFAAPAAHSQELLHLRFGHQNSALLLTGGFDGRLLLHDTRAPRAGQPETVFQHATELTAVSCNQALSIVASASADGLVRVTDLRDPRRSLFEHGFGLEVVSLDMNMSCSHVVLALSGIDAPGVIADRLPIIAPAGEAAPSKAQLQERKRAQALFAGTTTHDALVVGIASGLVEHPLAGHVADINRVAFNNSGFGNRIVTCSADNTLRVWTGPREKKACRELQRLDGHTDAVTSFDVSYDSGAIVSISQDSTVRLWSAAR